MGKGRNFRMFAVAAAVGALAAGCVGSAPAPARGPVVDVTVRDFRLSVPHVLPSGPVTLRIHNLGPDDHEVIVVRTNGRRLPFRTDGITLDEDAFEHDISAALEPVEPRTVTDLHADLKPGRYQLFCNMSGHYLSGMHESVVVR